MDMSAACTAPTHATITKFAETHPRFAEYLRYRSAMSRQMVSCGSFEGWLAGVEEYERGKRIVFQVTSDKAILAPGWYINVFAPRKQNPQTFGPFKTEEEAKAA